MIITKTPYRISFFGGGTDLNQWFSENGGAVISTSIDKYCYISCRYLPKFFDHKYRFVYSQIEDVLKIEDIKHPAIKGLLKHLNWEDGIELHHDGDLPARSGLGSSSSFTVGMINALAALKGNYISKLELAKQAIHLEQKILKENVGCQDQIAAAIGGYNKIEFFGEDSFRISPIIIPEERLNKLEDNLLLFFTGISRFASEIEKSKIVNFNSKRVELTKMHEMVDISIDILVNRNNDLDDFGRLLNEGWHYKKSLSSMVSNNEVDNIYSIAMQSGALGGKLLGAGGGGFVLFYAPKVNHEKIIKSLRHLIHVPFKFENSGSTVALYQPNGL
jgi:D-glycero-alpha-D-manno-heptose-7-phosphate kinase